MSEHAERQPNTPEADRRRLMDTIRDSARDLRSAGIFLFPVTANPDGSPNMNGPRASMLVGRVPAEKTPDGTARQIVASHVEASAAHGIGEVVSVSVLPLAGEPSQPGYVSVEPHQALNVYDRAHMEDASVAELADLCAAASFDDRAAYIEIGQRFNRGHYPPEQGWQALHLDPTPVFES